MVGNSPLSRNRLNFELLRNQLRLVSFVEWIVEKIGLNPEEVKVAIITKKNDHNTAESGYLIGLFVGRRVGPKKLFSGGVFGRYSGVSSPKKGNCHYLPSLVETTHIYHWTVVVTPNNLLQASGESRERVFLHVCIYIYYTYDQLLGIKTIWLLDEWRTICYSCAKIKTAQENIHSLRGSMQPRSALFIIFIIWI